MSLTAEPSLHRFTPRRALETTAFGYEVIASNRCLDDCIATVQWIDCWCPDAAQFILVEASSDLGAKNCQDLVRSIDDSHLRHKIRLVCRAESLADEQLLAILHRHEIGFLLVSSNVSELKPLAAKGILGVRADTKNANTAVARFHPRQLVRTAHDLGLRLIASQIQTAEDVGNLLAIGFDYVSQSDGGFVPTEPSFAWQGRVV